MKKMKATSLAAAVALAAGISIGTTTEAQAANSGRASCSTGKGVLRASDYWTPNVSTTLHQVYLTKTGSVKGNTVKPFKYELHSVKVSNGAKVTHRNGAWIFQVPRNKKVNVTVTWRAKHPLTIGSRWTKYASCTMKVG